MTLNWALQYMIGGMVILFWNIFKSMEYNGAK